MWYKFKFKKVLVNNNEEWSISTINLSQNIAYFLEADDSFSEHPSYSVSHQHNIRWELMDQGDTLSISLRNYCDQQYISNAPQLTVWFVNISTGEFVHNNREYVSSTNSANNFIINVHDQLNDYDWEETMLTIHQM